MRCSENNDTNDLVDGEAVCPTNARASERKMVCKKQHFVPQHYLRQFRISGTNLIAAARVDPFKFIGAAGIKHQCQEDYFYEDRTIDEMITELEGDLAPILLRVARTESFDSKQRAALNFLAASLNLRTRKMVETSKLFPKHIAAEFTRHSIETGKLPPPRGGWDESMIDFKGMPGFIFMVGILPSSMEMETLACNILRAPAKSFFITSDNPVVLFNQLLKDAHPHRSFAGFGLSGFQLILPISPTLCLFFFDPNVYYVGSGRHQVTNLCKADIKIVNSLQIQNADKCLYFHDLSLKAEVEELTNRYSALRTPVSSALRTFDDPEGRGHFIHFRNPSVKMPKSWNFCRIRRNAIIGDKFRRDPFWTDFVKKAFDDMENDPEGPDLERSARKILGIPPDGKI